MKCYVFMNTAFKRNSTISLNIYKNWCPYDDHLSSTYISVTELRKGALGKNTSKDD